MALIHQSGKGSTLDIEQNRAIVTRIFEQAWSQADFNGMDAVIAEDAQLHIRGLTLPTNAADLEQVVARWHRAFAGFKFTIKDMIAKNDTVAVRLTMSGTHQGQWQDIPPTGRQISVDTMMFLQITEGEVTQIWETFDEPTLRKQLTQD
jgi:steroid delta-isomerase-like uncharacterized protein